MEKIECGMYVRTIDGFLWKPQKIEIDEDDCCLFDDYYYFEADQIIKASNNIIDLIEAGDYVNGLQVYETGTFGHNGKSFCRLYGNVAPFYEEDIKSIVTKETYESVEYKVNE